MNTDEHRLTKVMVGPITVLLLMTGQASAQPCGGYEVSAIIQAPECPPFGFSPTLPRGMNDVGWVVGNINACFIGPNVAFLWTPEGGLEFIPMPPQTSWSRAVAISGSSIVGEFENPNELGRTGFLYDYETDTFTSLGTLPGGNWSQARAINNKGEIVGFWGDVVKGPAPLAFLWRDGEMIDIHPDFGAPRTDANDINNEGLVTGWMGTSPGIDARAFIWDDGKVTELPQIPGGFTSLGTVINNRGQLTVSGSFDEDHAEGFISGGFLWEAGRWTDLGMLPGYDSMALKGLNDDGTVAGWSRDIQNGKHPDTGFVWQAGIMTNLNDLIPPESQLQIKRAEGVNAGGQIAALAVNGENDVVAVLLTPIQGPPGDLNNDCQVGAVDLLILLSSWGPCDDCGRCPADLNADCAVGAFDLLTLLSNWG